MAKNEKERANNCVFIVKERNCKKERESERKKSKKVGPVFAIKKISVQFCVTYPLKITFWYTL
jgi:hypothetical protein